MPARLKSNLPRLSREWYLGNAMVLWTHGFEARATGWLTPQFHAHFREKLLHACTRFQLACPAYVLMPDHWHLVWIGLFSTSDQLNATRFLRRYLQPELGNARLQDRAHDHVLREAERGHDRVANTCHYIFENPTRAGLVQSGSEWPYVGAMMAGYPDLAPHDSDYWDRFWKIYNRAVLAGSRDDPETQLG